MEKRSVPNFALGLMSGTSCDGISAALVEFRGRTFRLIGERTLPYSNTLSSRLQRADTLTSPGSVRQVSTT